MWKDEVQKLNDKKGFCMVIYDGKVFNVFRYMGLHPGGEVVIRNAGGNNVTHSVQNIYNHPNQKKVLDKLKTMYYCDYKGERPKVVIIEKKRREEKGYVQSNDAVMCTWKD